MINILGRFFGTDTDDEGDEGDEKDEATLEFEASQEEKRQALESLRTKTMELRVASTTDPAIDVSQLRAAHGDG